MIITKEILNQKVKEDMMPTRLDSALNLYTNICYKDKKGIILYNTNPNTWNCLYPFYELNHKFTIDKYEFKTKEPTYKDLIEEYKRVYKMVYEEENGYIKELRKNILIEECKKTFNLEDVHIADELEPVFELKFSKSKNVWTLYYFENYVADKISDVNILLNQNLYEQKILPLDASIDKLDGIDIASNVPHTLSIKSNIDKLNDNLIKIENN